MKKKMICMLAAFALAIVACSDPQLNSSISGSAGNDPSGNDISTTDYNKSERLDYEDEWGSDTINSVVSGNDIVTNPWKHQDTNKEDLFGKVSKFNEYSDLMTPTYFQHYDGLWFIVDCYHDQIIYSNDLDKPFWKWYVLDKSLNRPHTIAFDGEVYMVDDTEDRMIVAYVKHTNPDGTCWFERVQEFVDMGERPHYVFYCEEDKSFYAWSSMSGQMWVFKRSKDSTKVFLDRSYNIPDLNGVYVRSFMFEGDKAYFVSGTYGNCTIFETTRDTFDVIREIPVAPEIGGMVQITKIENYYYVTSSTSIYGETNLRYVARTDSLEHLMMGQFEDLTTLLLGDEFPGTPYNITKVDDEWCLVVHREGLGAPIVHFKVVDDQITDIGTYH